MRRANKLKQWFQQKPRPMSKVAFAREIGCSGGYVSQLCRDTPPWPGRALARRIAEVTNGFVRPDDWAGFNMEACRPGDHAGPPPF